MLNNIVDNYEQCGQAGRTTFLHPVFNKLEQVITFGCVYLFNKFIATVNHLELVVLVLLHSIFLMQPSEKHMKRIIKYSIYSKHDTNLFYTSL